MNSRELVYQPQSLLIRNWNPDKRSLGKGFTGLGWLSLALAALLVLPPAFAALQGTVSARNLGARRVIAPLAPAGFTWVVNTTGDGEGGGPPSVGCDVDPLTPGQQCTLRRALNLTNNVAGEDTITFNIPMTQPNCDAATGRCTINLTQALPDITDSVEITGPGANMLTVRRNTGGNYRIFNVATIGPVTIYGLTISNGFAQAPQSFNSNGGGINKSSGTVNVINSTISGNLARRGGGINSTGGTLNIINSTVTGNLVADSGGGISNELGTVNVTNSTISGNHADEFGVGDGTCGGGGIANGERISFHAGILNVTNSTFYGNSSFHGGGICTVANSIVNLTNSTLSGNRAFFSSDGGGISSDSNGAVNVKASIIALSTAGRDVRGAFVSSGFNLIGKIDGSTGFTQPTDQTGTSASPLDPQLDPLGLQNNGGPTQTIALLLSSPAIDKGTSVGLTGTLTTDQRGTGFPRTIDDPLAPNATGGDGTDIGSFELQPEVPTPIAAGVASLINESCPPTNGAIDPGETATVNLTLLNNGTSPTTNLVATLQPNANVLAPSGPQTYGAVAPSASAGRDFTFTAAGNCGDTITLTLRLQDGQVNLGTASYTFTLGCNTACAGAPRISTSSVLSCTGGITFVTITLCNSGTATANNVVLTTAKLGGVSGAGLPQTVGTLAPGACATTLSVGFSSAPSGSTTLQVGGTYTGGSFNSNRRVTAP